MWLNMQASLLKYFDYQTKIWQDKGRYNRKDFITNRQMVGARIDLNQYYKRYWSAIRTEGEGMVDPEVHVIRKKSPVGHSGKHFRQ